ncbi:MAG: type 1 glutamine amidotransferase [Patescibacteria group bacterium]|jgi:GMP synthase (glutamine-hydrolysing)
MQILLIQVRTHAMREHEYRAIKEKMALDAFELIAWDVFSSSVPSLPISEFDAVIIGGSGEFYVSDWSIPEQLDSIVSVIKEARKLRKPIFGICFGHQLLAHALGGEVRKDVAKQETGTFEITCTEAASVDEIFSLMPKEFLAQEGHKDHVVRLPSGAIHLARTTRSEYQAFVMPGERIYGVQFHPELSKKDILTRLAYYKEQYSSHDSIREISDAGASGNIKDASNVAIQTKETPEAEKILMRFKDLVARSIDE